MINSPYAVRYKNEKRPKCFVLAGIFAGAAQTIFHTKMDCEETKCIAAGSRFCEFEIKPSKGK